MLRRSLRKKSGHPQVIHLGAPILDADCLYLIVQNVLAEPDTLWKYWYTLHVVCGKRIAFDLLPFFFPILGHSVLDTITSEMVVSCLLCDRIEFHRRILNQVRADVASGNFAPSTLKRLDASIRELGDTILVMHRFLASRKRKCARFVRPSSYSSSV